MSTPLVQTTGRRKRAVARVRLRAGAGQITETETITITLPGRYFSHPLARALVEQRRNLAFDYGEAAFVLDVLQAVTRRPEALFSDDETGVYLTVRSAIRRLARSIGDDQVADVAPNVIELLWQAALSGNVSGRKSPPEDDL